MKLAAVAVMVVACVLTGAPAAAAGPRRSRWEGVLTAEVAHETRVFAVPGRSRRGKLFAAQRLPILAQRGASHGCPRWLQVGAEAWICSTHARPSRSAALIRDAAAIDPAAPTRARAATLVDATWVTLPTGRRRLRPPQTVLLEANARRRGGKVRTDQGWVAEHLLAEVRPSTFVGVGLAADAMPARGLAWIVPVAGETAAASMAADGAPITALPTRWLGEVIDERPAWLALRAWPTAAGQDDVYWVRRTDTRRAQWQARPHDVAATRQWLDIDLAEQVLVAYAGDAPVYATLISSGAGRFATPTGRHVIHKKAAQRRLQAERPWVRWNIPEVPWILWYREAFALHTAYWHDDFGRTRSHGCINLAPLDARWIFHWVGETLPPGWSELDIAEAGAMVQIRSARDPSPRLRDWDGRYLARGRAPQAGRRAD